MEGLSVKVVSDRLKKARIEGLGTTERAVIRFIKNYTDGLTDKTNLKATKYFNEKNTPYWTIDEQDLNNFIINYRNKSKRLSDSYKDIGSSDAKTNGSKAGSNDMDGLSGKPDELFGVKHIVAENKELKLENVFLRNEIGNKNYLLGRYEAQLGLPDRTTTSGGMTDQPTENSNNIDDTDTKDGQTDQDIRTGDSDAVTGIVNPEILKEKNKENLYAIIGLGIITLAVFGYFLFKFYGVLN